MAVSIRPWLSPRVILVPEADGTSINMQTLVNEVMDWEDELGHESYARVVQPSGKTDLGGGLYTGITARLLNSQIGFEQRTASTSSGTCTSTDSTGRFLEDTAADFVTDGVEPGATIVNFTDQSVATVLRVIDLNNIEHIKLDDGTNSDWTSGDVYKIWNTVVCEVSAGNLAAVDDVGASMESIFPTAFVCIKVVADTSAAILGGSQEAAIADAVWDEAAADHRDSGSFGDEVRKIKWRSK